MKGDRVNGMDGSGLGTLGEGRRERERTRAIVREVEGGGGCRRVEIWIDGWREGAGRVDMREWEMEGGSGGGSKINKDGGVRERRYSEICRRSDIVG